jgi:2-polyprenyl-6-methoxyphenol hydroxylase-like FAD-dependent oxidoreductase
MMEQFDGVIVVGAGPVGLMTALTLAQRGVSVLVLEAAPGIIKAPRAIVYHPPTVAALDAAGVLDDMKKVGVVKYDYQWRSLDGRILCRIDMSVLRPEDTTHPYNLHLGQHELARVVLRHLERLPNAEVRWGHRVTKVMPAETDVTVAVEVDGEPQELRAPWLVGADGANSAVRQSLGLSFDGITWPEWFVATDVYFDFAALGYAKANFIVDPVHWAIIPIISNQGLWRLTYGEPGDVPREALRSRVAAKYAALLPGGDGVEPEAFSPYRVHDRCADRFRVGRVLLAGDAAHINNPIGGLGLTGGLLDAAALGETLGAVVAGRAPDHALDHYAAERRRIFLDIVSPTAAENKRRTMESDPEKRRIDLERFRRLSEDPAFAREALTSTKHLVGTPSVT